MDRSRIASAVAFATLRKKTITFMGLGAVVGLARSIARCGGGSMNLVDFDTVGGENLCRQDFLASHVGTPKVEAGT